MSDLQRRTAKLNGQLAREIQRLRKENEDLRRKVETLERAVKRVQGAARTLDHTRQGEMAHWKQKANEERVATLTLDSERDANSVLTDELEKAEARVRALEEAVTPSAEPKAAYMGEFEFTIRETTAVDVEWTRYVPVPWTTIKEIMKAIRDRAARTLADAKCSEIAGQPQRTLGEDDG